MIRVIKKYSDKVSVVYDTKDMQYKCMVEDKGLIADDEEEAHQMATQQQLFFDKWALV